MLEDQKMLDKLKAERQLRDKRSAGTETLPSHPTSTLSV